MFHLWKQRLVIAGCAIALAGCSSLRVPEAVARETDAASAEFVALIPHLLDQAQRQGPRGAPLLVDVQSFEIAAESYAGRPVPRERIVRAIGREHRDVAFDDAILRLGEQRIETVDRGLHVRVGGVRRTPGSVDFLVGTTYTIAREPLSALGGALLHVSFIRRGVEWHLLAVTPLRVS